MLTQKTRRHDGVQGAGGGHSSFATPADMRAAGGTTQSSQSTGLSPSHHVALPVPVFLCLQKTVFLFTPAKQFMYSLMELFYLFWVFQKKKKNTTLYQVLSKSTNTSQILRKHTLFSLEGVLPASKLITLLCGAADSRQLSRLYTGRTYRSTLGIRRTGAAPQHAHCLSAQRPRGTGLRTEGTALSRHGQPLHSG